MMCIPRIAIAALQTDAGAVSASPALHTPIRYREQSRTGFWAMWRAAMPKRRKLNKLIDAPHVRLYRWLLDSPAYLSLSCPARAVLVEIARVYDESYFAREIRGKLDGEAPAWGRQWFLGGSLRF